MAVPPMHFPGKSIPMTVITPIKRWWQRVGAKIVLFIFKHLPLGIVKQLAFIHFARWMVIPSAKLPRMTVDQPKEAIGFDLYLFSTNFNGSWDQYIDAFGRIKSVSKGLNMLWYTSDGFPGPWPMRNFKRYIRYFEYPVDQYFNAYPGAAVRDIETALTLNEKLQSFTASKPEDMSSEEFGRHYRAFLVEAGPLLGTVGLADDQPERAHHAHPQETGL